MKISYSRFKEWLLHYTWDLAYGRYDESILSKGLDGLRLHLVVNPYKNKWFADPFILYETDEELHLLVEEFDSDVKRGRIAHLTIDKKIDEISDCRIILDLPTHLSFPAIYRIGRNVYVHPENSHSGKSNIYKYDQDKDILINPICVCDEPIADAVIEFKDGHYEMFATKDPNPNGCVLTRYEAECLIGPYKEVEQIVFKDNIARMAGAFVHSSFGVFRPAQDCNGAYGKAVIFMNGNKVISELRTHGIKYAGIHTFNKQNGTFVVDLKKYDFPFLYYLKTVFKG